MPIPGRHNVQNALAAIAVALELGISDEAIVAGFERFEGVKRRFTKVGDADGAIIIDDYAHHPTEIRAVLAAAREGAEGRVIAVMQPHRYTRLQSLMDEFQNAFNDADVVFVTPVYAAGEEPIEGIDSDALGRRPPRPRPPHGARRRRSRRVVPRASRSRRRGRHGHLHGRGRHHQMGRRPRRRHLRSEGAQMSELATMPKVRGKLTPNAPLAPLVWFKSGGNGRVAVRAGRRPGSRSVPPRARPSCAGHGARPRLQPHRPRRRRTGRGRASRQAVRKDRAARRDDAALRRRRKRNPRLLDRARSRHCRARVPSRNSWHSRRLRADERRRLWPRGP